MTNLVWTMTRSSSGQFKSFGRIEADVPAMGEQAAGAQSQSTPGASALAAPLQQFLWARDRRALWLAKWLGVIEATVLFGGVAGLVAGLYWLATNPLAGVIAILASIALLLSAVAKLGEAQELRLTSAAGRERFSRRHADSSDR